MKICFIGGGNALTGELNGVVSHLFSEIKVKGKVLIIPFAAGEGNSEGLLNLLIKVLGAIGNVSINLLDEQLPNQSMQEEIDAHDVLFFTGGRPEVLMEKLAESELIATIKNFQGVLVGFSAGALAFSRDCVITKDDDYPETHVIPGIGLTDFSVEVHYDPEIDDELSPLTFARDIYALPNGSALIYERGVLTPISDVHHFSQGVKRILHTEEDEDGRL